MQDVWAGKASTRRYHEMISRLMADLRRERPAEATIAAHLLDVVDPRTGKTLPDEFLQPQIAQLFLAGSESAQSLLVCKYGGAECGHSWQHAYWQHGVGLYHHNDQIHDVSMFNQRHNLSKPTEWLTL